MLVSFQDRFSNPKHINTSQTMINALKMLLPIRSDISSDNESTSMYNNEDKQKLLKNQDYNIIEKGEDPPPPYSQ